MSVGQVSNQCATPATDPAASIASDVDTATNEEIFALIDSQL